jgi:hypothetical protein
MIDDGFRKIPESATHPAFQQVSKKPFLYPDFIALSLWLPDQPFTN